MGRDARSEGRGSASTGRYTGSTRWCWLRLRRYGDSAEERYTWDLWDVSDPERPVYRIEDRDGQAITSLVIPGAPDEYAGDTYPAAWRLDGRPIVPVKTRASGRY